MALPYPPIIKEPPFVTVPLFPFPPISLGSLWDNRVYDIDNIHYIVELKFHPKEHI